MTGRPTRTSLVDVHLFGFRRLWIANPSAPTIAPPPIESETVRIAIILAISTLNYAAGPGEEMTDTSPKAGRSARQVEGQSTQRRRGETLCRWGTSCGTERAIRAGQIRVATAEVISARVSMRAVARIASGRWA